MTRQGALWAVLLCAGVAATNRYTDLAADGELIGQAAGDSYSYLALAQAAPGLPTDTLAFHHAQRIALPFLIGTVHRLVPVPLHVLFLVAVLLLEVAILLVCAGALDDLAVRGRDAGVLLAMLALNPWAFRYYVTFPEMVNDLGFVLGLAIMVRGLLGGGIGTVVAGQVVASLGRQTGLLLVPFALVWVWRDGRSWARHGVRARALTGLAVAGCGVAIYCATAAIAARVSGPAEYGEHLLGLVTWVRDAFDPAALGLLLLRMLAPVAIPVVCWLALARRAPGLARDPGRVPLLVFGGACCWVQPLLAGPAITGGNGERLVGLGLVPLVLALALRLRDAGGLGSLARPTGVAAILVLLGIASLHHLYTSALLVHPGTRGAFAIAYAAACAGMLALVIVRRAGTSGTMEESHGAG